MVSFVHHVNSYVDFAGMDIWFRTSSFTTCYKFALFRWQFDLHPEDPMAFEEVHTNPEDEHKSQFSVRYIEMSGTPVLRMGARPSVQKVRIDYKVLDTTGAILHEPPAMVLPWEDVNQSFLIRAKRDHEANILIEGLIAQRLTVIFSFNVMLFFEKEVFEVNFGDGVIDYRSLIDDFRHVTLHDPTRHDYFIICRGRQTFGVSREGLNIGSGFFRQKFRHSREITYEEDCDLAAVRCVITHLLCGDYVPPERMSPALAKEILILAEKYGNRDIWSLHEAVEASCLFNLVDAADRLEDVLDWLQMSEGMGRQMARLCNATSAILIERHWQEFTVKYGPAMSAGSALHRVLHVIPEEEIETTFESMVYFWRKKAMALVPMTTK